MATKEVKQGKGYTAPKGRPTVHRNAADTGRRLPSTVQWVIAIVVFVVVLGIIFYVGRDFRTVGGGTASSVDELRDLVATVGAVAGLTR